VTVRITRDGGAIEIRTPAYTARTRPGRAQLHLASPDGRVWTDLSLLASVDRADAVDEAWEIPDAELAETADGARVRFAARSTAWASRVVEIDCLPGELRVRVHVEGDGRLDEVTMLGGRAVLANGAGGVFRSSIEEGALFVPTPTEPVQGIRSSASGARIGVVGDAEPGRLHGVFSPAPLCLALGRDIDPQATALPSGDWLALSVVAPIERLGFTAFGYEPLDGGFVLRLSYEGRTLVRGAWTSPDLVLRPAGSPLAALTDYRDDVAARGFAGTAPAGAAWHVEPLFCGWGAQCAYAVDLAARGIVPAEAPPGFVLPEGAGAAPDLARQDLYDGWLATLGRHGIDPGTVVVDDRWQAAYGTNEPDSAKWPDLRGWIRAQHAAGRRVLLWFKAWDPDGLDPELTLRDPAGRAVAADPGNPAYLAELRRQVHRMLGTDGLDADGFKVDFTQRAPSGRMLAASPGSAADDGVWGLAALHRLVGALHAAAHETKPDALVVTHTMHPSFAGVTDMIRLNDVLERDVAGAFVPVQDQLRFRHAVAHAVLPDHPIDTDQWPMPDRASWLAYAEAQPALGVPALYYVDSIDGSGERVQPRDLDRIARTWRDYRADLRRRRT
jgi:hypothetical protein